MKNKFTKELLSSLVKESLSLAEVLRKLGLAPKGGNYDTLKRYIILYDLNVTHFTGQKWNKGLAYTDKASIFKLDDILKENVNFKSDTLKKRLFREGIKEYKCEICGISEWNNEYINLELHHINGNHYDNRIENLQILCPNCHSQTNNFRNRNNKKNIILETLKSNKNSKIKNICEICGKEFEDYKNRSYCSRECYNKSLKLNKKTNLYTKETLKHMVSKYKNITEIAKELNVSRTTVKKLLIDNDLYFELKEKYDFNALSILQYSLEGEFIKEWGSISDAEEHLKIHDIGKVLKNKRKSAGGFRWKYKKDVENLN
jgi:Zn finger protein HypA/HybF involved in hydrogenase expression